ncbi:hypothetical protein GCG54_00013628 [Colletotrichum gloeosporioides]|uniref:Clavaminate synthase-like protein n=1 Tax=Colletotrichum gloeosporioides TaxID=474922 RepID=A0A8H4FM42_COLGL|nr:uncharacterized protein GCG54_00013628 [Colletotrichum gloeosporioides]KAF3805954.1 hypothetical protein GCG54_00013628 [Colletotrichum gloeosporioides]
MAIDDVLPPMPQFAGSIAGKPEIPPWDKPDPTKEHLDWAELRTLDLSLLDGDPNQQAELVETTRLSIQKDGFLFYIFFHGGISEEEKEEFMWDLSKGTFRGYKPQVGWGEREGQRDQIEHFNWYQLHFDELPESVPSNMPPFLDEIQGFAEHMANQVNRRLLVLLSRILGMPDKFLWEKVSARGSAGDSLRGTSYHSHMGYHNQPVSCLQMLNAENEWRWVGYEPGRLLVNLDDALDVISSDQFKVTRHKDLCLVPKPPRDQMNSNRIGLIIFNNARPDMRMDPMMDTPLLRQRGLNNNSDVFGALSRRIDEGLEAPTYQEWKTVRSQGAQAKPEKTVDIDGVKYKEQMFNGTKLLMVV